MDVFALGVSGRDFFTSKQQRVVFRESSNFIFKRLEPGRRRRRLACVVFGGECKIVGVVRAAHEIEADRFCGLLEHFGGCSEFHMVGGVVRVAVHFSSDISWRLRECLGKHLQSKRFGS